MSLLPSRCPNVCADFYKTVDQEDTTVSESRVFVATTFATNRKRVICYSSEDCLRSSGELGTWRIYCTTAGVSCLLVLVYVRSIK